MMVLGDALQMCAMTYYFCMSPSGGTVDYPSVSAIAETQVEIIVPETSRSRHTQKITL